MISRLGIGSRANDFRFETPWGDGKNFYEAAEDKPAVLVFLRYLGCPICQNDMANLKREVGLIKGKGAKLFVILQSSPHTISSVTNKEDWPFTIICDPLGELFRLYGVEPGGIIKYLHPAGLISAIRATMQGYRHGKFEGYETQLPAVFIVGKDKMIKYAHYGRHLSDIPSPEAMAANI
jgi:peroxiredoxin